LSKPFLFLTGITALIKIGHMENREESDIEQHRRSNGGKNDSVLRFWTWRAPEKSGTLCREALCTKFLTATFWLVTISMRLWIPFVAVA
jgi:hypothetical protein